MSKKMGIKVVEFL